MSEPAWIPTRPGVKETGAAAAAALAVAAGTAAVTFWLVRTLLSREPVELRARPLPSGDEGPGRPS